MTVQGEWVCFDIPFFLQVPDSFENNDDARFYPSIGDDNAELRFERSPVETDGGGTFGMAAGDRLGNVSYTKVRVGLGGNVLSDTPEPSSDHYALTSDLRGRDGYLIRRAVEFLNRFLRAYRVSLRYYWIRPVTPHEIVSFDLISVLENGDEKARHRKITPGSLKLPNATISEKDCEHLNKTLQRKTPPPVIAEIDLDTQDKIDLEETSLAVLNAERLFEIWIKNAMEVILGERGWSSSEIEGLMRNEKGEYEGLSNIVKNFIDHHLGFKFTDTKEYKDWKTKTQDLRNAVAHEGYAATKEEALDAYEASIDAIFCLNNEFEDELSGSELMMGEKEEYLKRNMLL